MIDSHLHLDDPKLRDRTDEILRDCEQQGIEFVINNSCDFNSMKEGVRLAEKYDRVFATVGMHPHDSKNFDETFVAEMTKLAAHPKTVAMGEIGLDYFYDLSDRQTQRDVFAAQIELADKFALPVTLHVRDAYGDAWDILRAQKKHLNNGVLWHCFGGSAEFARQAAKEGHYFAFGGAITFKNARKEEVIRQVPFDRVLSETDSPYMSPEPLRGRVNTPLNVPIIVGKLAEVYQTDVAAAEAQIRSNTLRLFPKIAKFAAEKRL